MMLQATMCTTKIKRTCSCCASQHNKQTLSGHWKNLQLTLCADIEHDLDVLRKQTRIAESNQLSKKISQKEDRLRSTPLLCPTCMRLYDGGTSSKSFSDIRFILGGPVAPRKGAGELPAWWLVAD